MCTTFFLFKKEKGKYLILGFVGSSLTLLSTVLVSVDSEGGFDDVEDGFYARLFFFFTNAHLI